MRSDDQVQLRKLLIEFRDIFSIVEGDLGTTNVMTHKIDTGNPRPVLQPLGRQPLPHRSAVNEHLDSLLVAGTIEPAISKWATNVMLARKNVVTAILHRLSAVE